MELHKGARVLQVGTGSGYAAAVLSRIAAEVFTIERMNEIAELARTRLQSLGYDNVTVLQGNGFNGLPDLAPFDAILISVRGGGDLKALKSQLSIGGALVGTRGRDRHHQTIYKLRRVNVTSCTRKTLGEISVASDIGEIMVAISAANEKLVAAARQKARSEGTALEAIRAAQTGHLVLSTLHCNDAVDAVQRLFDLGMRPNSIASELLAVAAQRLAKRLCVHCRMPAPPAPEIAAEVFPDGLPGDFQCFTAAGCKRCGGVGTSGRIAVLEFLRVTAAVRSAIAAQLPLDNLRSEALKSGLITMRESALRHVQAGTIAFSELPRLIPAERLRPEE